MMDYTWKTVKLTKSTSDIRGQKHSRRKLSTYILLMNL